MQRWQTVKVYPDADNNVDEIWRRIIAFVKKLGIFMRTLSSDCNVRIGISFAATLIKYNFTTMFVINVNETTSICRKQKISIKRTIY